MGNLPEDGTAVCGYCNSQLNETIMIITAHEARKLAEETVEAHNERIAPLYVHIRNAATQGKREIRTIAHSEMSTLCFDNVTLNSQHSDAILAELKSKGFRIEQASRESSVWGHDEKELIYYYIISW